MLNDRDVERVLVLVPAARDRALAANVIQSASLEAQVCGTVEVLCAEIARGAGAVLLTEETLRHEMSLLQIRRVLSKQEPWSDLPIILFSALRPVGGGSSQAEWTNLLGNITVLDRPTRVKVMISALRVALRSRRRQYAARRAIRERDEFLAMLGHELRNPLAAVAMAGQILGGLSLDARAAKPVAVVRRQTQVLTRLVDDLLDVSRVTAGKIVLQKEIVNLREVLQRCVATFENDASRAEIKLELAPGGEDAWVAADVVRLEQIFSNLITNGIKYTPRNGEVKIHVDLEGDHVIARVSDNGNGIAANMLDAIFNLFIQVDRSPERSRGGMGIGLTLVRSLVEMHGGQVMATSAGVGLGSTFSVRLPAEKPPAKAKNNKADEVMVPRRVVVVEDNEDLREGMRDMLTSLGCEVVTAADGPSGTNAVIDERPDLAFVDIGLPGHDGYEVAQRVRNRLGNEVVLVAVTGYGQAEDKHAARAAGFSAHLTKPIDFEQLRRTLIHLGE